MSAKKIIAQFTAMSSAVDRLHKHTSCFAAEKAGVKYTEEERVAMHEASGHLSKAKEIVTKVWSKKIGDAVTQEIRCDGRLKL